MKFLLVVAALVGFAVAKEIGIRTSYEGFQVLTATASTPKHFEVLKTLLMSDEYDFWTSPKMNGYTDIMVNKDQLESIKATFAAEGMEWTVKIQDVGKAVDQERALNDVARIAAGEGRMAWTAYQRWDTIEPWIRGLPATAPNTISVSTIGQSSEGRNIYMVKVSTGPLPGGAPKKAIFIDSNIHAREWISGAAGTWMLNELVTNLNTYAEILSEIDFYFVPMVNVDGYEFTHTSTRMWRKTRSVNSGSTCRGCDPNRNFAFHWGGESTSSDPCSDLYKGPSAFSEPETQAIRNAIRDIELTGQKIWSYVTLHSYAQLWLLSWGYTSGVYPEDYPELLTWGRASIAALQAVHGTRYQTGQGADMLYGVGGASDDYAKSIGIKYSTTAELRDTGSYGFILPPAQIIPTGQETWAAVLETVKTVRTHP